MKPTVKKMPLWGIFREERLWRHSYAQDATGEAESLGLYKGTSGRSSNKMKM
ncbi:MAG: hypothetical protein ACLVIK_09500 [Ruminococcus sp.]|nr:hypothetical protein [Ruminococcus bromii]